MVKRNMKMQINVPPNNKSNQHSSSAESKTAGLNTDQNTAVINGAENINIEPALLNHIRKIRNIDERVLLWDRNDVLDSRANERLHSSVNANMVMASMLGSPFSGYLRPQMDRLEGMSRAGLGGAVMVSWMQEAREGFDSSVSAVSRRNMDYQHCGSDPEAGSSTMSFEKIEQASLSPNSGIRTSGRSAKKNYRDMLIQPFATGKKATLLSNNGDCVVSVGKKTAVRRGPSKLKKKGVQDKIENNDGTEAIGHEGSMNVEDDQKSCVSNVDLPVPKKEDEESSKVEESKLDIALSKNEENGGEESKVDESGPEKNDLVNQQMDISKLEVPLHMNEYVEDQSGENCVEEIKVDIPVSTLGEIEVGKICVFDALKDDEAPRPQKRKMGDSGKKAVAKKMPKRNSLDIDAVWATVDVEGGTEARRKRVVKATKYNDYLFGDQEISREIARRRKAPAVAAIVVDHEEENKAEMNGIKKDDVLYRDDEHEHEVLDLEEEHRDHQVRRRIKQAVCSEEDSSVVRVCGPRVKQVSRQSGVLGLDLAPPPVSPSCHEDQDHDSNQGLEPHDNEQEVQSGHSERRCGKCKNCLRHRVCGRCAQCVLNKTNRNTTGQCMKTVCRHPERSDGQVVLLPEQVLADGLESVKGEEEGDNTCLVAAVEMLASDVQAETQPTPSLPQQTLVEDEEVMPVSVQPPVPGRRQQAADLDVYRDSEDEDEHMNTSGAADIAASEEENIDPDSVSTTMKNETLTTTLAHEGGYPVVTSRLAMPNKVLCYSCGSGDSQMIHCVSCAEPFHFFCIEFQFRPKSKEMFVCRNCTKCHLCGSHGSDLKCIKCQLGFHPACVEQYPPSRSEDRSNWACYMCAMCLHCGTKAEDAMGANKSQNHGAVDWARDPWQCGRCSRARKEGHVCPECGRAYQAGLETVECVGCCKQVHRQCAGLTEDEYEVQRENCDVGYNCSRCCVPVGSDEDPACKSRLRTSLRRQCKEPGGLKVYCERQVQRRSSEFVRRGEVREEGLLEEQEGDVSVMRVSDQMDGLVDEDEEESRVPLCPDMRGVRHASGESTGAREGALARDGDDMDDEARLRQSPDLCALLCNSSESIEEYEDVDQLTVSDLEPAMNTALSGSTDTGGCSLGPVDIDEVPAPPRAKIGLFSRLAPEQFLTPRHMLLEVLARINMKLGRCPTQSSMFDTYSGLLSELESLCADLFPWIDFAQCLDTVQEIVRANAGRGKLVLKAVADLVKDGLRREAEVFSATVWSIEEKLGQSLVRGREEFIIYHSEQHLTSLMKCLEQGRPGAGSGSSRYEVAFPLPGQPAVIVEEDVRRCALCGVEGDDGLEGRLLHGLGDVWLHVNCALWSDEVFEREDGALVNVEEALARGERTECGVCGTKGATVHCSVEGCRHCYHFGCAFNVLHEPVFTESRRFYCGCADREDGEEEVLGLADMLILRRIYVPGAHGRGGPRMRPEDVVVTIGNLRVEELGVLRAHSDQARMFLCPVNYRARRLFWSMNELDSLVMYEMAVREELGGHAGILVAAATAALASTYHHQSLGSKRRRVMDSEELQANAARRARQAKETTVVYEMDDQGNLRPLSAAKPHHHHHSVINIDEPDRRPHAAKVNRRFPKEAPAPRVYTPVVTSAPAVAVAVAVPPAPRGPTQMITSVPVLTRVHIPTGAGNTVLTRVHAAPLAHNPMVIQRPLPQRRLLVPTQQALYPQPWRPQHRAPPASIIINNGNPLASTLQPNQRMQLLKVTRLSAVSPMNFPLRRAQLPLQTQVQPQPLTQSSSSSVVLRTALAAPQSASRSPYIISASGPIIMRPPPRPSWQLDGQHDDDCSTDNETVVTTSARSRDPGQGDEGSAAPLQLLLKYVIEGFTASKSPKSAWTYLVRKVAKMRAASGFTSYPLKTSDGWDKFGIAHRWVVNLLEQLPGAPLCLHYDFKYHKAQVLRLRNRPAPVPTNVLDTRSQPWTACRPAHAVRDPLAFLGCKSNRPPRNHAPCQPRQDAETVPDADYIQNLAIQFRQLKSGAEARAANVCVCVSGIHGRGLFSRREFGAHEIIIEYVGETIRSVLSDVREVEYQKSGVDCYMFRLDRDVIVDATCKGNAARFINHSCQPNCYAKVVKFEGDKHIIIIAQRRIYKGEELTYDYRFPLEDDKLVCTCGSRQCRKYLN